MSSSVKNAAGTEGFNFKKLAARTFRYWYWYLFGLIVAIAIALVYIHFTTPMYTVSAQVLVKDGNTALSGSGGGSADFNIFTGNEDNLYNELAILQTKDLCLKVVQDMKLYKAYYIKGKVRDVELYNTAPFSVSYQPDVTDKITPVSLNLKFNNSNTFEVKTADSSFAGRFNDSIHFANAVFYFTKTGQVNPSGTYIFNINDPLGVAGEVASNLSATLLDDKTSVVNLTYKTAVPEKGRDVLNQVIKSYMERNLNEKNQLSDSTLKFINSRIALVGGDLGAIESNIQNFKQENKITDLASQSGMIVSNSNNYNAQLNTLTVQLQVIQTMLDYLQQENNNNRPVPALLNDDPTFQSLLSSYNNLQMERDKLLFSVKENNSMIQSLDAQIASIRASMIQSLKSQQKALTISKDQITALSGQASAQINSVPVKERQSIDLARQRDVEQSLYLFLLQKKEETAIGKAANLPNISIIESPKANWVPFSPNWNTVLTIAALLGLAIPFGIVQMRFLLNKKVTGRDDVNSGTPIPVLAEIGHSSFGGALLPAEGYSIIAEQFRTLRTNLKTLTNNASCPVILFSSATKGEGKSFVAANLAQMYAISGKKVLLMELDLRQPTLSRSIGVSATIGFTDYISSNDPVQRFIQPIPGVSNFYILPAGTTSSRPAELLLSAKFPSMMQELKRQFDVIIIDAPPAGGVSDAQILGEYSDVTLYVVRQNYTVKDSFDIVNDLVEHSRLPNVQLILNDVKGSKVYSYAYGVGDDSKTSFYKNGKQRRKAALPLVQKN